MNLRNSSNDMRITSASQQRRGIVLLVVLGMLTLFSMLAVSYLVFSARHKSAAEAMNRAETSAIDSGSLLDQAMNTALVGSNGPSSALWGHSLLGDLYGMRDGVASELTIPSAYAHASNDDIAPAALLDGNFIRFPTELFRSGSNTYPFRRNEPGRPQREYPASASPSFPIDDQVTGRLLTFREGPLANMTMEIVRYFGNHLNLPATNPRRGLSGQVVVDVRPHLNTQIELNGRTLTLREWINLAATTSFTISELFYDRNATATSGAIPLSDFYVNGRILNGPGLGWDHVRDSAMMATTMEHNLNDVVSTTVELFPTPSGPATGRSGVNFSNANGRDLPVALQGHYGLHRLDPANNSTIDDFINDLPPGDVDEGFDAPTYDDLWLSYFPNDPELGQATPSFVRPALINWLINQKGDLTMLSQQERTSILRAIQRSTLRPLPISNSSGTIPNASTGTYTLNFSEFTGSNGLLGPGATTLGTLPIDPTSVTAAQILRIARALAGSDSNGDGIPDSWDVDTDGDGIPDSVWVDSGLALIESPEGQLIKPMVAYKIEALSGRADVNRAGNTAQAINQINATVANTVGPVQQNSPTGTPAVNPATVPNAYIQNDVPSGFGYGPAEIDLRAIFLPQYATGNGMRELMKLRYNQFDFGAPVVNYYSPGEHYTQLTGSSNDLLGRFRHPSRPNFFAPDTRHGLPYDPHGRATIALGVDGGLMVNRSSYRVGNSGPSNLGPTGGQINDDPYEIVFNASTAPDATLKYADLEPVLRFNDYDRDLLGSRLVDLINNYHADPSAVPDQLEAVRKLLADSVTTSSSSAATVTGLLPSEWRNSTAASQGAFSANNVFWANIAGANAAQRNARMWELLAPELRRGSKFNLNRPFENGVDDDGDGVIDDPEEIGNIAPSPAPPRVFYNGTRWATDRHDVTPAEPGRNSRETFARHLYFMALSLIRDANGGTEFDFPHDPSIVPGGFAGIGGLTFQQEYNAWKIAQWAINVVDFRDQDGIMTRFRYDPNPFDGWDVDTSDPTTYRTVWGMEHPELTLDESLAFHDRRLRDTAEDTTMQRRISGGTFQDDDPDQWRIPQGSLFLEVRSTRSPQELLNPPASVNDDLRATRWAAPVELYERVNNPVTGVDELVLQLDLEAPDMNPVWRVAISEIHEGTSPAARPERCPDFLFKPAGSLLPTDTNAGGVNLNRETTIPEPNQPNFFEAPVAGGIERVIWFTNRDPDADADGTVDFTVPADSAEVGRIFYNRFTTTDYSTVTGGGAALRGGQYAVIGPRQITPLGSLETHATSGPTLDANNAPQVNYTDYESTQRIGITAGGLAMTDIAGNATTPTADNGTGVANATIQAPLGVVAAANAPLSWGGGQVGVNVSEPLPWATPDLAATPPRRYYPQPTRSLDPTQGYPVDSYYDYSNAMGQLPDTPFDSQTYAELDRAFGALGQQTGTRTHFKTAYLQRLADPTEGYHPTDNPYITVDYIAIDLTVFNGAMTNDQITNSGGTTQWRDEADMDPFNAAPAERFATRYKTGSNWDNDSTTTQANQIFSINTFAPELSDPQTTTGGNIAFFNHKLHLDPLVDPDAGGTVNATADRTAHSSSLGYLNASFGQRWGQAGTANASMGRYVGLPFDTFGANVQWLNRDFVSPIELAWVPTSAPGRLGAEFGTATTESGMPASPDPYDDANNSTATTLGRYDYNQQFPHLWNFLSSNVNDFSMSPNMLRILEWVEVPPPFDADIDFVSTDQDVLDPTVQPVFPATWNYATFGTAPSANPETWNNSAGPPGQNAFWLNQVTTETLRPPFNIRFPNYRTGMVNLNVIKNKNVFKAVMNGFSTSSERAGDGAFWDDFIASRRGYATPAGDATGSNPLHSSFSAYFPTQQAGAFRPANTADVGISYSAPTGATAPAPPNPIMRRDPVQGTILRKGPLANRMLFRRDPTMAPVLNANAQSPERSVVHQQLGASRLANLTSNQSNIFAVWITVGFFEVDPSTLLVGPEVGLDLGQTQRPRGFYIIDRSVPVMYRPGEINNTEGVIQLSRKLN